MLDARHPERAAQPSRSEPTSDTGLRTADGQPSSGRSQPTNSAASSPSRARAASTTSATPSRWAGASRRSTPSPTSIRSSSTRSSSWSSSRTRSATINARGRPGRGPLRGQAAGLQRCAARESLPGQDLARDDPEGPRAPQEPGHRAGVQARRHLRRRVRGRDAVLLQHVREKASHRASRRHRAATEHRCPMPDPAATTRSASPTARRSSSSAAAPTASARASSSTTAAATPRTPPRTWASRA